MNPEHAPVVQMKNIEKHFGSVIALAGVSLEVYPGECHCLLGDNGAGKSTFIKTMSGVHKPTNGEIFFEGKPMHFERPRDSINAGIATVYQDLAMIPLMSVSRNFFMGNEPIKKIGPLRLFDHEKANEITMTEMRKMGINLRGPDPGGWNVVWWRTPDRCNRARGLFWRQGAYPGRADLRPRRSPDRECAGDR